MKISRDFYRLHKFVTLAYYVMFINSITFLVNLSRNIGLVNVEHVHTRTLVQLANI